MNTPASMSEPAKQYGIQLRRLRKRAGLHQQELARRAGITVNRISEFESFRSRNPPSKANQAAFIESFGLRAPGREDDLAEFERAYTEYRRTVGRGPEQDQHDRSGDTSTTAAHGSDDFGQLVTQLRTLIALLLMLISVLTRAETPPANTAHPPQVLLHGWIVAVEQISGTTSMLTLTNLQTGRAYQLMPPAPGVPSEGQQFSDPHYSTIRHELAYIRVEPTGRHSLWVAPLGLRDDVPQIGAAGPHELLPDCSLCRTLTWSPQGDWLLFDGPTGLMAINRFTQMQRRLTQVTHDGWPACSPDGRWLVYQYGGGSVGFLLGLPSADCLPVGPAPQVARLIVGAILGWRPAFSLDGSKLAFVATPKGSGPGAWQVYVVALDGSDGLPADSHPTAYPISAPGCTDPAWITASHPAQPLVVYACASTLLASQAQPHPWHATIGTGGAILPTLFTPCWLSQ